ncbi:MAG TPA: hypothetical protein VK804_08010 [Bradyrhizobium sp.]|uniref:hypothetical protein n=1 Tax=Bradyrhizobium sp. TaxID=376 RepID=UPI002C1B014B|nr:hypothetical protein [Bradyrhizobium sp.]HTB00403.1 hypothetical protein [Bradyrhizobium sp.]
MRIAFANLKAPIRSLHPGNAGVDFARRANHARIRQFKVQPRCEKYSAFAVAKISFKNRHPVPQEGRLAIVTDAERDAVDADAPLTNGTEADGEVVWS